MNVFAVSTPHASVWRWRIVNLRGETVEESSAAFPTITAAVAAGNEHVRRGPAQEPPRLVRARARRMTGARLAQPGW